MMLRAVMQLLYTLAGSEEAYRQRPFVTHHYCPVVSPLTMDQLVHRGGHLLQRKGIACLPEHRTQRRADLTHVHGGDAGAGQC